MSVDPLSAFVFLLHVLLGGVIVLSAFAAGSRGIIPGLVAGILVGSAVILGDLTVGQELLAVTESQGDRLAVTAAAGAALGIVSALLLFEPGEPDSTDSRPDPTTYTNR